MHRMSRWTQLVEKLTTCRIYPKCQCDVAAYITKSLQMSEDSSNPVYKLITDSILQLVLINVLIRSIFEQLKFYKVV